MLNELTSSRTIRYIYMIRYSIAVIRRYSVMYWWVYIIQTSAGKLSHRTSNEKNIACTGHAADFEDEALWWIGQGDV